MKIKKSHKGFAILMHPLYPPDGQETRLAQESSAISDYDDAREKPGSSFLWIGEHVHLNREEVREFVNILTHWLETGRLAEEDFR